MSAIQLESAASFIYQKGNRLLVLTALGNIYLWDIYAEKSILSKENMIHLIQNPYKPDSTSEVVKISLEPKDYPSIFFDDARKYLYNSDLKIWVDITESSNKNIKFNSKLSAESTELVLTNNSIHFIEVFLLMCRINCVL